MADEKGKNEFKGEKRLGELAEKVNKELSEGLKGRPYLVAIATGYELEHIEGKSRLAAQWSWRTNVIIGSEDGEKVMEFLSNQLKEVVEHPQDGVKAKYAPKK